VGSGQHQHGHGIQSSFIIVRGSFQWDQPCKWASAVVAGCAWSAGYVVALVPLQPGPSSVNQHWVCGVWHLLAFKLRLLHDQLVMQCYHCDQQKRLVHRHSRLWCCVPCGCPPLLLWAPRACSADRTSVSVILSLCKVNDFQSSSCRELDDVTGQSTDVGSTADMESGVCRDSFIAWQQLPYKQDQSHIALRSILVIHTLYAKRMAYASQQSR